MKKMNYFTEQTRLSIWNNQGAYNYYTNYAQECIAIEGESKARASLYNELQRDFQDNLQEMRVTDKTMQGLFSNILSNVACEHINFEQITDLIIEAAKNL